jgi:hypothetical protein
MAANDSITVDADVTDIQLADKWGTYEVLHIKFLNY